MWANKSKAPATTESPADVRQTEEQTCTSGYSGEASYWHGAETSDHCDGAATAPPSEPRLSPGPALDLTV